MHGYAKQNESRLSTDTPSDFEFIAQQAKTASLLLAHC